uniref:TSA: Wollemia nobilis Ref_Wollemi_Transcript_4702_2154 transcribed RNA sequence n=1 Tax=Wollemia nobilis TaxID=56998 RepID=A0A0C9RXZ6_9CONI
MMAGIEGGAIPGRQQQTRDRCQTSEDDESGSIGSMKKKPRAEGGLSLDVTRKPRGRPPGSKNKAKPPVIITRDSESAMRPHILEFPAGSDIVQCLMEFSHKRQVGICVLTATGTVGTVTLRQGTGHAPLGPPPTVTLNGRFEVLSLTGAFLASDPSLSFSSCSSPSSSSFESCCGLSISLAGPQGQVVGGRVGGVLTAAGPGPVVVWAACFVNPSYHNLGSGEDDSNGKGDGDCDGNGNGISLPAPPSMGSNGYTPSPVYGVSPNPISSQIGHDVLPWSTGNGRPSYSIP